MILNSTDVQQHLGVQDHNNLKVATQVDRVVKAASGILVFTGRDIEYKSCEVMMQLYRILVGPHLEQCTVQVAILQEGCEGFQRVQRWFTSMTPGLGGTSYRERLGNGMPEVGTVVQLVEPLHQSLETWVQSCPQMLPVWSLHLLCSGFFPHPKDVWVCMLIGSVN